MTDYSALRARYGEAFWRTHHEAWKRSDLNQREYCESQRISLKAFGNWREVQSRASAAGAEAALPPWRCKSQPKSHGKSQPKSRDLSLFGVGAGSNRSASARRPPAKVQRDRPAAYPRRGSRAKQESVRGCAALRHRPTGYLPVEAGAGGGQAELCGG